MDGVLSVDKKKDSRNDPAILQKYHGNEVAHIAHGEKIIVAACYALTLFRAIRPQLARWLLP